ncbi:hypothetical protein HDU88_004294 [Geranomyces variabilis]|nr:hypothetical protein HDU88_004294 [Geranomyces variabilis]
MERRPSLRYVDAGKTLSDLDPQNAEKPDAQQLAHLWIPIFYLLGSLLFLVSSVAGLPYYVLLSWPQLPAFANILGCALFSAPILAEFIATVRTPQERTKTSGNETKTPVISILSNQSSLAALEELPSPASRLRPRLAAAFFLIGIILFDVAAALPTSPKPALVTTLLGSAAFLFGVVTATARGVAAAAYAAGSVLFAAGSLMMMMGTGGLGIWGMWLYIVGSVFYSVGSAAMVVGAVTSRRKVGKTKVWCESTMEYGEQFEHRHKVQRDVMSQRRGSIVATVTASSQKSDRRKEAWAIT